LLIVTETAGRGPGRRPRAASPFWANPSPSRGVALLAVEPGAHLEASEPCNKP